jgi:hypothetical protein
MTKRKIFILGVLACALSMIGFFVDDDVRVPNIATNIFEIVMVAGVLFILLAVVYLLGKSTRGTSVRFSNPDAEARSHRKG